MSEPNKAVFLSYASQDAEAARRIADALRAAGLEVWFDQSELRGGDAWDQRIRRQIKECALFVPIISAATQARHEGYFRLEWRLADQRTHLMGRSKTFLLPVCIDETSDAEADVPDSFVAVQWVRLAEGKANDAFGARVKTLLGGSVAPVADRRTASGVRIDAGQPAALPRQPFSRWWLAPAMIGAAIIAVVALWRPWREKPAPPSPVAAATAGPMTEAAQLATRARDRVFESRDQLQVAIEMAHQATDLAPDSARAWAVRARLDSLFILRGWDVSEQRRQEAQGFAKRALALDPNATDAMLALAVVLQGQGAYAEVEALMRRAVVLAPDDALLRLALGDALSAQGKEDEALAVRQETFRRFPDDPLAHYNLALSYEHASTPDFDAALRAFDDSIALQPYATTILHKVSLLAGWKGDLPAAQRLLDSLDPLERTGDRAVGIAMILGLLEHQPVRTIEAGARTARPYLEDDYVRGPKAWSLAHAYALEGKPGLAQVQWRNSESVLRERLHATPDNWYDQAGLGVTLAWLGERDEAARLVAPLESAARESPPSLRTLYLAYYHAGLGDAPGTVSWLQRILGRRELVTVKTLPLDPWWDKIRAAPEFQALLASARNAGSSPSTDRTAAESGNAHADANEPGAAVSEKIAPPEKSVAVLAFDNLSDDKANEYFADGISEELLNALGKVPGLKVTARTSAFSFKGRDVPVPDIARQLGVAYVVEGSVRKQGDRVRITAQLVKAADGFQVWSDQFDRELKDIFAVQDEIAAVIASNLSLKMGVTAPAAATVNPAVFQLYAEARQLWNVRSEASLARMEQLLSRALELDPHFAPAEAGLAQVWVTRVFVNTAASRDQAPELANAVAHARKAIALDPTSAEAFEALGTAALVQGKLAEAETAITRAVTLNPNYATGWNRWGWLLARQGRVDMAVEKCARGREIDPLAWPMVDNYGLALMQAGRPAEAMAVLAPIRAMPDSAPVSWANGAVALMLGGRNDEALAVARVVTRGGVKGAWSQGLRDWSDGLAAWVLAEAGARDEARGVAERLLAGPPTHRFAAGFALVALGRENEGCAVLEGMPQQLVSYLWLLYQRHEQLADDPRFQRLLGQLNATAGFHVARETLVRMRAEQATKK